MSSILFGFNNLVIVFIYSLGHRSCRLMFNFFNKSFLTLANLVQWIRKCCSSSIWLHWEHNLFSLFIFGLKYLPFSIKRLRELNLNLVSSLVIFTGYLPDVSDVWRWPNPVKTLKVLFYYKIRSGTKERIVMNHIYN